MKRWIICCLFISALAGCDSRDSGGAVAVGTGNLSAHPPPIAPFTGNSSVLGELDGTLAATLEAALVAKGAFEPGSQDGPVFVGGDILSQQPNESLERLAQAYADGRPIVFLQPTPQAVLELQTLLGLEPNYQLPTNLPDGREYPEAIAFDRESTGEFRLEIYPPEPYGPDEFGFRWEDSLENQAQRVELILDWCREDNIRPSTLLEEGEVVSSNDLRALAQAQVNSQVYTNAGAIYQITHYIYSCHSFTDPSAIDSDWFYVQQSCQINYSGGYSKREGISRALAGLYGGSLELDNFFFTYDNAAEGQNVLLAINTPENANNVSRVSSGVSWSFGGTVGFRGKEPTGGISGGVSVSHSESFEVSDCQVVNNSLSRFNNALWSYNFEKAKGIRYPYYAGLTDPPALSRTNFQPVNQWIWRVSPKVRNSPAGARFRTSIKSSLVASNGGTTTAAPYVGAGPFHKTTDFSWNITVPVSYPPVLVAPGSLNFDSAARFQTMEFAASQDWTVISDQPWCTLTPASGTAALTSTNVTVEQNDTGADRTATLTITTPGNNGWTTVQIFQSRFP